MSNKKNLSERDICTQYINPALRRSGWDFATQVHGEVALNNSRVIVRGKLHTICKPTTPTWGSTVERLKERFPSFDSQ